MAFVAMFDLRNRGRIKNGRGLTMVSRLAASILCVLTVSATSAVQAAPLQRNDDARVQVTNPIARLFGMSASPIARETVNYPSKLKPGSIVINTGERRLYFVLGNGQALRYGIGVGREGFSWSGTSTISAKREWPDWTPPEQMRHRRPDLPVHMDGGIENPLGARALYLGSTLYRIHGTNEPNTIGQQVSSGCIRLTNEDVIDLYNRAHVGATVVVLR
jgi:lipoprotein-anchoring transpeptidase ErfK/SrfK